MFKKWIVLIFAACAFVMTGCASIDYSRVVEASGKVTDRVIITLDLEALANSGYHVSALVTTIATDLDLLYFSNVREFVSVSLENENLTTTERLAIAQNITTSLTTSQNLTTIVATIVYGNQTVFNQYYAWVQAQSEPEEPQEETATGDVLVQDHGFYTTYIQTASNAYGNVVDGNLSPIFEKYFTTLHMGEHFTLTDLSLTQTYASSNLKLDSNATTVSYQDGLKVHTWTVDPLGETTLQFYSYSPNTYAWYLTALGLALVVAISILAYGLFTHKKAFTATKIVNFKPKNQ